MRCLIAVMFVSFFSPAYGQRVAMEYFTNQKIYGKVLSVQETVYAADAKGNYAADSSLMVSSYKFNDSGFVTEGSVLNNGGVMRTRYKFDSKGRPVTGLRVYTGQPDDMVAISFEYNDKGRISREKGEGSNFSYHNVFSYDDKGNRTGKICYQPDDHLYQDISYGFDEEGRVTTYKAKTGAKSDNYVFEYSGIDKYGNWTKRIIYMNDKPETVVVREIKYY